MTWFTEKRLTWIKESVLIFGAINREHIQLKFGISLQQASFDIQEVLARWPDLMSYDKSRKCYQRNNPAPVTVQDVPEQSP